MIGSLPYFNYGKVTYYKNGQLESKGNFIDFIEDGPWIFYYEDGTVDESLTGTYKNGKRVQ